MRRVRVFGLAVCGCLTLLGGVRPESRRRPGDGVSALRPGQPHYVSPGGLASNPGSRTEPWDLASALAGASGAIAPGDTVWLRGGVYRGRFRSQFAGEPDRPVVFRQYPGERATIDGTLRVDGTHLVFWGFEIMQSEPRGGTYGLQANGSHARYINLIIHDAGTQGVSFWNPGIDSELYGCIIYNNGTHENLDHGVYIHNEAGTKVLRDNIFFNNYALGIHLYASPRNAAIRGVRIEGNVAFNNATISQRSTRVNLLVSAKVLTEEIVASDNLLYYSGGIGTNIRVGNWGADHNRSVELRNNYAGGGRIGLQMDLPWERAVVQGNTFISPETAIRTGGTALPARYVWHGNRYARDPSARAWVHDGEPYDLADWRHASGLGAEDVAWAAPESVSQVFVKPNRYEPGRATIVVYNWGNDSIVHADVEGLVAAGERFAVHNVQDLFGPPVVTGQYVGAPIAIAMRGVDPPVPIGRTTPRVAPRTAPQFDVFVFTRQP